MAKEEKEVKEEKETPSGSSPEEKHQEEELVAATPEEAKEKFDEKGVGILETKGDKTKPLEAPKEEPKPVEGETEREHALRKEVERVKGLLREKQTKEFFKEEPKIEKPELSPEKKQVLEKYNSEEVQSLKEVFGVLADEMGFVKKDEFAKTTYQQSSKQELDDFLKEHPEYLPENDKDNLLWDKFKDEFSLYRQPKNPKDLRRIFAKIHKDIFGISEEGEKLKRIEAEEKKISVASHSAPSSSSIPSSKKPVLSEDDLSYLKGVSEKERKELLGEE